MFKKIKWVGFILIAASLFITACSSEKYSDDVSCRELSSIVAELDGAEYSEYGEEYITFFLEDSEAAEDFCVLYTTEVNDINEIGFFRAASNESAEELYEELRDYLEDKREGERAFVGSYAPEELPKLDGGQVKRFGRYVVYAIADADMRGEIFDDVKARLEK